MPPAGLDIDGEVGKEGWQWTQVAQEEYRTKRRLSFYTDITAQEGKEGKEGQQVTRPRQSRKEFISKLDLQLKW